MSWLKSRLNSGAVAVGSITLISKNTELHGDVHFSGSLEIEGRIHGNIYAEAETAQVRVCESGYVQGEIYAPRVIINGHIEGDVHAGGQLELAAKARVRGDVYYDRIEMVMGAEVNGVLHHVPSIQVKQITAQNQPQAALSSPTDATVELAQESA